MVSSDLNRGITKFSPDVVVGEVHKTDNAKFQPPDEMVGQHTPSLLSRTAHVQCEQRGACQAEYLQLQQDILDALPCSVAVLDDRGMIVAVNAGWRHFADDNKFAGSSYGVGMNYFTVCEQVRGEGAEEALAAVRGIREVLAYQRDSFSLEYACHSPERQRWFSLHVGRSAEEPVRLVMLHQEISARKQTEEALRESEERFRSVFLHSLDAILFAIPDGRILSANPAACLLFGRTEEEICLVGRDALIDPSDPRRLTMLEERRRTGRARAEVTHRRKDGTLFDAEISTAIFTNREGEERSVIILRDITERKSMVGALREAHKQIEDILESITDAFFAVDAQWRFTYLNGKAEYILRRRRDQLLGKVVWVEFPQMLGSMFEREARRAMAQQTEVEFEAQTPLDRRWVELHIYPHANGLSAYCRDVTERKRLEQEILEISGREQQRIGHDLHDGLGQHLTGLAFMSKLLAQQLEAQSAPEAAQATKLTSLINDAIQQARILAQGLTPVKLEDSGLLSALQEWASGVMSMFHVNCQIEGRPGLEFHDPIAAMHAYRITQEAVHNAIKHGKATRVLVRLQDIGERVRLRIRDNGSGIPKMAWKGEGMGIRIMQYRAKMMQGVLRIRGVSGKGTVVECVFPNRPNSYPDSASSL